MQATGGTLKRPAVISSLFALALAVVVPAFAADAAAPDNVVPFKLLAGHFIVVKCSAGAVEDLTCIVDTGATETVLDKALVRRLSLATEADTATFLTETAKVWAVTIPELRVGPLRAERLAGIAADLSSLTAEMGIRPQVVIGMDLLHRMNFVIDYHARRLSFGVAARLPHSAALVSLDSADSSDTRGSVDTARFAVIESTVMGKTVRLQVDTGFDGLLLYRNRLRGRGELSMIAGTGQTFLAHSVDSPGVQIGDWLAPHDAQVHVVNGAPQESAGFDGVIGTSFLSKRQVGFDFEKGRLWWE